AARRRPLVLKVGGELLEDRALLAGVVSAVARMTIGDVNVHAPLVIIHGGGKEIDAALKQAGLEKRQVDGLRITDGATLEVVVAVLGAVNTRLVAALNTAGVPAVGLTGADANCGLSELAAPHRAADGRALAGGVDDVVIVDGRDAAALVAAAESDTPPRATRLIATATRTLA